MLRARIISRFRADRTATMIRIFHQFREAYNRYARTRTYRIRRAHSQLS